MKTTSIIEQTHRQFGLPAPLRRVVAATLIAGAILAGSAGVQTGSAHTLPPCTGWSQQHQMSIRQPSVIRFWGLPGPTVSRVYCRVRPGDPIHINYAVVDRRNV
jgi:hypothetical protein